MFDFHQEPCVFLKMLQNLEMVREFSNGGRIPAIVGAAHFFLSRKHHNAAFAVALVNVRKNDVECLVRL
jgi:hypothetical protein